jgi:TusA-related sulfurtransferase
VRSTVFSLAFALVLLRGCDSCNSPSSGGAGPTASATPSTTASAVPPASASSPTPAPSASVAPSGKMAHCPNAVTGAKTAIADVPGGVTVTVTASDPTAMADVRARVQALLDAQKNASGNVKHTGNGEGGGLLGRCPIVLKNTTIVSAELEGGDKLTITAKDPQEVDWLRRETRDRQEDLEAAGSPAGTGKMSHCPSALAGVTTTLKNTKDGVTVTVVGKDDPTTKSIRERVQHLVEVSKNPEAGPAVASHTGEGGGGGTIGRCPIVLKDTALLAKDIPGGSSVDVKAKVAGEVTKLQAEAKERAAKFQLPAASASAGAGVSTAPATSKP